MKPKVDDRRAHRRPETQISQLQCARNSADVAAGAGVRNSGARERAARSDGADETKTEKAGRAGRASLRTPALGTAAGASGVGDAVREAGAGAQSVGVQGHFDGQQQYSAVSAGCVQAALTGARAQAKARIRKKQRRTMTEGPYRPERSAQPGIRIWQIGAMRSARFAEGGCAAWDEFSRAFRP